MKFEFGIMSRKWKMEAFDMTVAKLAMTVIIGQQQLPIAIYKPEQKGFIPSGQFLKNNKYYKIDEVKKALKTVREI